MSLVSSRQTIGPREHEADEVRVLLIHQAFVSPNEPGGTRHYELGQRLVSAGHTLTIVASRISYLTGTAHQGPKVEHLGGIQVRRAWVPAVLHKSFLWRVAAFLIFMVSSVITALRSGRCDLVMGTSPPLFQALSAWLVAKVFRAPFLLEIRDLWPEFASVWACLRTRY